MSEDKKESFMNLEKIAAQRKDPGFFRDVWQQARLVYRLLRDPEVPFYLKLLPFTAVLYLLWPIDIITDLAPFIGQLDDVTVLLVGSKIFIEMAPPHIVSKHMNAIREQDGFSRLEEDQVEEDELNEQIVIDPGHEVVDKK